MKYTLLTILGLIGLIFSGTAQKTVCPDADGAADHPLVSRYEGSCIIGFENRDFDRFEVPLGAIARDAKNQLRPEKVRQVEGKISRLIYAAPENKSAFEVQRNYESALKKAGYKQIFQCSGESCGKNNLGPTHLYPLEKRLDTKGAISRYALSGVKEEQFAAFQGNKNGKTIIVSVYTGMNDGVVKELKGRAVTILDVIEQEAMESDKVSAESIEKGLASDGYIRLYNLYFDFGKAELKADSDPALSEMAQYLKANPQHKVYIVGHTDNVGDAASNLDLSKKRAQTVVNALSTRFAIPASQIEAQGVGPYAPVASNADEKGRALNRRVEMVLK